MEIDELSNFLRAIRFGFEVQLPSGVTDQMIVEMARHGDLVSGLFILRDYKCRLDGVDHEQSCPKLYAKLIESLAYGLVPDNDLKNWPPVHLVPLGKEIVISHTRLLGPSYSTYLQRSFNTAVQGYNEFAQPPNSECYIEEEIPGWLTQAFNVASTKTSGKQRDLERDAEVLDGVHSIFLALAPPRKYRISKLERELRTYSSGDMPQSIKRLITLRGYPDSVAVCASSQNRTVKSLLTDLAKDLIRALERAQETIDGPARARRMAAANMFMSCQDFNIKQVEALLESDEVGEADKARLRMRRRTLSAYGNESLRKNNKTGNASGFERIYRNHKGKLPNQSGRRGESRQHRRTIEESARLLANQNSIVRKARQIICSQDVGNQHRAVLQELYEATPNEHRHVWHSEIWTDFEAALVRTVKKQVSA